MHLYYESSFKSHNASSHRSIDVPTYISTQYFSWVYAVFVYSCTGSDVLFSPREPDCLTIIVFINLIKVQTYRSFDI